MNPLARRACSAIALSILLVGCGKKVPGSRQELDVRNAQRSGAPVTNETQHEVRVPVGPDSAIVTVHWTTGAQGPSRVISRAYVDLPAHKQSETFSAGTSGRLPGSREAPSSGVLVRITYISDRTLRDSGGSRTVLLRADGTSQIYADGAGT
jgi:hypothetical protein